MVTYIDQLKELHIIIVFGEGIWLIAMRIDFLYIEVKICVWSGTIRIDLTCIEPKNVR